MPAEGRRHHDMGGGRAGAVLPDDHASESWEKRVDALMVLLSHRRPAYLRVDELRESIEALGPQAYDRLDYYERWMYAIVQVLIARGVISIDELAQALRGRARD